MGTLIIMNKRISAPVAEKIPHEMTIHGHTRVDNYYWMRDDKREDQRVIDHLNAENDYLKSIMKPTEDFQKILFDEMLLDFHSK